RTGRHSLLPRPTRPDRLPRAGGLGRARPHRPARRRPTAGPLRRRRPAGRRPRRQPRPLHERPRRLPRGAIALRRALLPGSPLKPSAPGTTDAASARATIRGSFVIHSAARRTAAGYFAGTLKSASPEPTLPAASRTRSTITYAPAGSCSVWKRNVSRLASKTPSAGKTLTHLRPFTANDADVSRTSGSLAGPSTVAPPVSTPATLLVH